jgi:hypothetical protein
VQRRDRSIEDKPTRRAIGPSFPTNTYAQDGIISALPDTERRRDDLLSARQHRHQNISVVDPACDEIAVERGIDGVQSGSSK